MKIKHIKEKWEELKEKYPALPIVIALFEIALIMTFIFAMGVIFG